MSDPHATTRPLDAPTIRRWLVDRLGPGADPQATFHEQGLDSLATTALFDGLSAWLGRRVPPTLAWDHPTPARLAAHLAGEVEAPQPATGGVAADEPIAIVGLACRLPGAASAPAFWRALCEGRDCTGPVPPGRWAAWQAASPSGVEPVARGGFLDAVEGFDAAFFGIAPREAHQVDPQQRLMLELTWEAFEDAGLDPTAWRGAPVGVFTGLVWRDYADLQSAVAAAHTAHTCVGHAGSIAANRVSYAFGFEGPSLAIDTACSSALVAVHTACESLRRGESRLAVAGGVQLNLSPRTASAVEAFGALARDGRCKTFSAAADGYGRGEGAGVVLLEPLSAARRAGRTIYAVIRGSAVNNDGASNGITAPNPAAQRRLLRAACARAGVDPAAVHYVELHGTGTPLGDPLEAGALGAVLGAGRPAARALRVGSVKSNIGHLEAAAGIAGLIKLALSVAHRALPPSLHGDPPNPEIDFDGWGLRLQRSLTPWPAPGEVPVGGVSSFGFGGTNCHVVLTGLEPTPAVEQTEETEPPEPLEPPEASEPRSVVFVFAGAGTPRPAIAPLLADEPAFRATFERCDAVYRARAGWSLLDVALDDDGRRAETGRYQLPLNLAFGLSMAARWRALGVEPAAVLGYSVGEWAAACVAGAITLEEAFAIAHAYTEVQQAVAGGAAMGVVGLPADALRARLADAAGVWVSAENGPRSAGIGGEAAAVEQAVARLAAEGVFARRVRIDFFAHVPPAAPLGEALAARLAGLRGRPTAIPFASTVRGEPLPGTALDAAYWGANLAEPVAFGRAVAGLRAGGARWWLDVNAHPIHGPAIAESLPDGEADAVLASAVNGADPRATLRATGARLRAAGLAVARVERPVPVLLSARDPAALRARAAAVAAVEAPAVDVAAALAARASHHRLRLATTAADRGALAARLAAFGRGEAPPDLRVGEAGAAPAVVFAFTGQGTQWAGMARDLVDGHPVFRAAFFDFAAAVADVGGPALAPMLDDPPVDTAAVQPLVLAVQLGIVAVLADLGIEPAVVLGHSLGELAAAHVAGAIDRAALARLVVARGRAMAAPEAAGAMAAVDADEAALGPLPEGVVVAAHNGPRARVLAGDPAALGALEARLAARGVGVVRLAGDRAFHSPRMAGPAAALRAALADFAHAAPRVPVVSTTTGAPHADFGPAHWAENVRRPVRFAEALSTALAGLDGAPMVVEIGPHPALSRHIEGALADGGRYAPSLRRGRGGAEALADLVGALYVAGLSPAVDRLFPEGAPAVALPAYPWQRQRFWFAHDAEAHHPLLGARARRTADGWRFEAAVSAARPALLADHRYGGEVVVAGAALVGAALDAAARVGLDGAAVENVTFHRALVLGPEETRRLVFEGTGDGRFEVSSIGEDGAPRAHADGALTTAGAPPAADDGPAAARARCAEVIDPAAFFSGLAASGIALGPRFRWLEAGRRAEDELVARLRPVVAADGPEVFGVPPGLIDGCFQLATLLAEEPPGPGRALMVLGVERLRWWAAPEGATWCHLRRRSSADGVTIADGRVYAEDGRPVARIEGLAVRSAPLATMLGRPAARVLGWRWTAEPARSAGALDGRWRVRGAPALAAAMRAAGAEVVEAGEAGEVGEAGDGPWAGVVDAGIGGSAEAACADAMAGARAVMAAGGPPTVWIARGAVAPAADERIDAAEAARWGVAHTAARELPEAGWRLVDVGPKPDWPAVVAELGAADPVVALRDGRRLRPRLEPIAVGEAPPIAGRWLISGGLGALGLAVAERLARAGAAAVVLMGRRPPDAAAEARIAALRAAGAAVVAVAGDVTAPDDVAAALAVEAAVPLHGVVHAAGVLADGVLMRQDPARAARALAPKLGGAEVLDAALGDAPATLVLFGSVAGAVGSPGQAPYAAANAALAAVARRRRAAGRRAVLIDWGPWADGMAARVDGGRAQDALALDALDAETALDAFVRVLGLDAERVAVVAPGGSLAAFDRLSAPPAAPTPAPEGDLRARVVGTLRAVLGLDPADPLDPDRPLQALGLDSLMALEARKRLAAAVGRALPATFLFDHPTVSALLAALAPAPSPAARRPRATAGGELAIVGLACRLPGGVREPDDLWRLLLDEREGIVDVPPDRWDADAWYDPDLEAPGKMVTRRGGFIDGIDRFDAAFFGMSAAEARSVDPQQRMLLELTWEALEHAGIPPSRLSGRRVGVFLGLAVAEYGQLELHAPDPRGITPWSGQGAVLSMAAGRIAYVFGFEGPAMVVDTACSSSLVAAHLAARSLRRGECDLAVIAGANLMLTPRMTVYFTKMRALSPDGRCKSFDADADGYGRAEGLGVIVAQRLEDARAEGQRVIATIRGTATNQDGRSVGVTAPRGPAQVQVIRDALDDAGLAPAAVDYVEAHGTGTPLGDPIELGALAEAYGPARSAPLRVGSLKSNIGHMEAAAGIGGLIKLALMVERGHMPRTLNVRRPTPRIDWHDAPLRLVTEARDWPGPRRIGGVSSFGFSGSNAHVVLGSPDPAPTPPEPMGEGPLILPLSARDPAALAARAAGVAAALAEGADLRAVARTAAHRRDALPHRLAVVAADAAEAIAGLRAPTIRGHAAPGAEAPAVPTVGASDPRRRLEALARAWVAGAALDWAALIPPAGPWAPLPRYPWQGRRYWPARAASLAPVLDDRPPPDAPTEDALYGRRLASPLPGWQFEARHARGWLLDEHRPFGRRIVAGAQHLLATLQAARHVGLAGGLADVEFVRPLAVAEGEAAVAHTTFTPDGAGHAVRIASRPPGGGHTWQTHLRAAWRADVELPPPPIEAIAAECTEALTAADWVTDPALGPRFRCLVELRRGRDRVLGRLASAADGPADTALHPGLLDSAFRALKALPGAGFAPGAPLIPLGARRVVAGPAAATHRGPVMLVGRLTPGAVADGRTLEGDLWLLDADGRPLLALAGLAARAVDGDELFVANVDPTGLCLEARWAELPAPAAPAGLRVGLVADGPSAPADALAAALEAAGHRVQRGDSAPLDALIDLRPLDGGRAGLLAALASAGDGAPGRRVWLTRGAAAVEPGEAVDPHAAALWSAVATVRAEAPALGARVVDLPPGPLDAAAVASAALAEHPEDGRVALRGDRRWAPRLHPAPRSALVADPAPVEGTWLITGGLGGVGLALAEHLVTRGVEGLLLVGRRPPDAAATERIERWRARGTPVRCVAVDVTDAPALAAALAEARPTLPPIVVAVHAAGVRGDAPLAALSPAHVEAVLAPKLDGAAALADATADDPLRALVLLGSIAGHVGNPGQAAYAAANGALDGLAHRLRAAGRPAIALGFGPWAVGMADEATRARLERVGAEPFAPAEGAALVSRLANLARPSLAVARIDWRRWARHAAPDAALAPLLHADAGEVATPASGGLDRQALRALDPAARGPALRAWLGARIAALLELDAPPADEARLLDLGFDSFFAVRLRGLLDGADLGVPIARLLDDATPALIAEHILADLAATAEAPAPTEEIEEFVF